MGKKLRKILPIIIAIFLIIFVIFPIYFNIKTKNFIVSATNNYGVINEKYKDICSEQNYRAASLFSVGEMHQRYLEQNVTEKYDIKKITTNFYLSNAKTTIVFDYDATNSDGTSGTAGRNIENYIYWEFRDFKWRIKDVDCPP